MFLWLLLLLLLLLLLFIVVDDVDSPILIVNLALSRQSCSACFLFQMQGSNINFSASNMVGSFACWCFVSDRRRTANSVSAVSHFWAFLFFLDLLCFYELKLVFDGDIDSDILLQASRKKKGQSGFCRWSFCNFCCCCFFCTELSFLHGNSDSFCVRERRRRANWASAASHFHPCPAVTLQTLLRSLPS